MTIKIRIRVPSNKALARASVMLFLTFAIMSFYYVYYAQHSIVRADAQAGCGVDCTVLSETSWRIHGNNLIIGPPTYYQSNGQFYPIDSNAIASTDSNYQYMMTNAPYQAYFKSDSDVTKAVRFIKNGYVFDFDIATSQAQFYNSTTRAISGNAVNPQHSTPVASGNSVTYPNAWSNANLKYTTYNSQLKEDIIINNLPTSVSTSDFFRYKINVYYNNSLQVCTDILYPGIDAGPNSTAPYYNYTCYSHPSSVTINTTTRVDFKDASGNLVFFLPTPTVTDANNVTTSATYFLTMNNGIDLWYLGVPKSFYSTATFPLDLDPTLTITASTTVLCGSDTTDTNITIASGGQLQICPYNGTAGTGYFNYTLAGGIFQINSGGWVNGTGAGYRGGTGQVNAGQQGESVAGLGINSISANFTGGGGAAYSPATGGGSADTATNEWDSSGQYANASKGGGGGGDSSGGAGGRGGGILIVNVGSNGNIIINGNITNFGQSMSGNTGGGGSGGGAGGDVWLRAQTVNVTNGLIGVSGGNGQQGHDPGGGGSAGRIKIFYGTLLGNSTATYNLTKGYAGPNSGSCVNNAGAGGGGNAGNGGNGGACGGTGTDGAVGTLYQASETYTSAPYFWTNTSTIINPYLGWNANGQSQFNITEQPNGDLTGNATLQICVPTVCSNTTMNVISYGATTIFGINYTLGNTTGAQNYTIFLNSSTGLNNNTATIPITVQKGTLTGSISGAGVTYPTAVNVASSESNTGCTDCNFTYWTNITVNTGTLFGSATNAAPSADTTIYGVQTRSWILNSSGGANYSTSASIAIQTYAISQGTPSAPTIVFSPVSAITYPTSDLATATVSSQFNQITWTLYRDNTTTVGTGTTSITETQTWGVGTKNYCVNETGNTNYTSSAGICQTLTINKGTQTLTINGNTTNPATYPSATSYAGAGCTFGAGFGTDVTCTLYRGNSSISTTGNDSAQLGVGYYAYNYSTPGGANWTSASASNITLSVTKGTLSTPSITFAPTSPIIYPIADIATATVTSQYSLTSWTLYRGNTTTVGTGTSSIADASTVWGVGTKNYCVNSTGDANYSASAGVCQTLTINQGTPSLSCSGTGSTYPTHPSWSGSGCPTGQSDVTCTLTALSPAGCGTCSGSSCNPDCAVNSYTSTYTTTGGVNYTSATSSTCSATVSIGSRTCTLATDKGWTRTFDNTPSSTTCSVSAASGDGTMAFTRDSVSKTSPDSMTNSGSYAYSCQWGSGTNYSACGTQTNTLAIGKANPVFSTSVSATRVYETAYDYSGSTSNAGDSGCTYPLLLDGVQIAIGNTVSDTAVRGVGSHNHTYYTTGCGNYNPGVDTRTSSVTVRTITIHEANNGTEGNKTYSYPSAINATTWKDATLYNEGTLTLLRDGTAKGTSEVATFGNGTYNYSAMFVATNYSASSVANHFALVIKETPSGTLYNNGSTSNVTSANSGVFNITGVGSSTDTITWNLYNSTTLIATGVNAQNITPSLPPGEYPFILNTSGNANTSAISIKIYSNVFNVTEITPIQTTSLSISGVGSYNTSWLETLNISNLGTSSNSVIYNYTIPIAFTPYNIAVTNSTSGTVTSTVVGNTVGFITESVSGSVNNAVAWTCMNCVSEADTIITYSSTQYAKNVSLTSSLATYHSTIATLTISVPGSYATNTYDLTVLSPSGDITNLVTVISNGGYYSQVLLSSIQLSNTWYEVKIDPKPAGQGGNPPNPSGGGGGGGATCSHETEYCTKDADCCGGLMCNLNTYRCQQALFSTAGKTIRFDVSPSLLEPYKPQVNSAVQWNIVVYNYEPSISLTPEWSFNCTVSDTCLSDWCSFVPISSNTTVTIAPSDLLQYNLTCAIPPTATLNQNYRAILSIWAQGYAKENNTKTVTISITPTNQTGGLLTGLPTDTNWVKEGFNKTVEWLYYPAICLSDSCKINGLLNMPLMHEPLVVKMGNVTVTQVDAITPGQIIVAIITVPLVIFRKSLGIPF